MSEPKQAEGTIQNSQEFEIDFISEEEGFKEDTTTDTSTEENAGTTDTTETGSETASEDEPDDSSDKKEEETKEPSELEKALQQYSDDPDKLTDDQIQLLKAAKEKYDSSPSKILKEKFGFETDIDDLSKPENVEKFAESYRSHAENQYREKLRQENPEAYDLLLLKETGGNPADYFKSRLEGASYADKQFRDEDTSFQEKVFMDYYKRKDLSEGEIQNLIEVAKDGDKLSTTSRELFEKMKGADQLKIQENRRALEKEKQEVERMNREAFDKVNSALNSGDLFGVKVPKEEVSATLDYMYKPADESGYSQLTLDLADPTSQALIAVVLKNKDQLSKVFEAAGQSKSVKDLSKLLDGVDVTKFSRANPDDRSDAETLRNIDLSNLNRV